jgi:hypothetical protein
MVMPNLRVSQPKPPRRQAVSLGLVVEIGQRRAGLHIGSGAHGIDAHRLHRRQVDHHAAFADRGARDVVACAAHGQDQAVVAREIHGAAHVGGAGASEDHRRPAVYHRIPDLAGVVVTGVARAEDLASG